MPDNICGIITSELENYRRADLSDADIDRAAAGLLGFRDLVDKIIGNSSFVFKRLFQHSNLNKYCYPCDVVELRNILTAGTLAGTSPVTFFPLAFATDFFTSYSAFLVVNQLDDCNPIDLQSLKVLRADSPFMLKGKLVNIVVNQSLGRETRDTVYKIAQDCGYDVGISGQNSIPGVSLPHPKVASVAYTVNIESLGIKRWQISADSEVEAVERVLNQRWKQLYGEKLNRSQKFRVEYWMNTAFWNEIVSKKASFNLSKVAQPVGQQGLPVTPEEQAIFDILVAAKQSAGATVEMRVAGGWVRDKLLGVPSDDIDVAISGMPGFDFAKIVERYGATNPDIGTAYNVSLEKSADPKDKTETNNDLMVGAISINGLKIELVPMRTEEYDPGSRTPRIARTDNIEEDVMRRDLTINAMYYNIENGQVEDYVGGQKDLTNPDGILLRTPDDPVKTFNEDPLRMLRALRFLARYAGARLDPATQAAFSDPTVRQSFKDKVSPSRIGQELWGKVETKDGEEKFKAGILAQHDPTEALRIMFDTKLDQLVFDHPSMEGFAEMGMDQKAKRHVRNLRDHTLEVVRNYAESANRRELDPRRKANGMWAALTHDFGKRNLKKRTAHPDNPKEMPEDDPGFYYQYIGHENISADVSEDVGKGMGIPPEDRYIQNAMNATHMRLHNLSESNVADKGVRRYLRTMNEAVENQPEYADAFREDVAELSYADVKATHYDPDNIADKMEEVKKKYADWISKNPEFTEDQLAGLIRSEVSQDIDGEMEIVQRSLQESAVQQEKPPTPSIFTGNDIMELFGDVDPKTGKVRTVINPQMGFIGEVKEMVADWLDENPDLTKDQIIKMIKENRVDPKNPLSLTIYDDIIRKHTPILPYREVQQMFKDKNTGRLPKDYRFTMNDYTQLHHLMLEQSDQPGFNPEMARQIALQEKQRLIEEQAAAVAQTQQMQQERQAAIGAMFNISKVGVKVAQDLGTGDNSGYTGFHSIETPGGEHRDNPNHATNKPAHQPYYEGQKVKMRQPGIAFSQVYGKIVSIDDREIVVQWNDGTEERMANDTSFLAWKIQGVN